jgi:hypothetical protein
VIYVINGLFIAAWLVAPYLKSLFEKTARQQTPASAVEGSTYQLPRIDLALITIAALTVYMAVRSRRFIPIAGYASCPIIALFADQIIQMVSASWNFHKNGRLVVPRMPRDLQRLLATAGAVVVAAIGIWWGLKFKHIYLDPWPSEAKLTSVFIRMTASAQKPFTACQFIRENHLRGNMFNYWTEGGFIAWGQEPDPNTGRTPLQLFMDGRAQAAYNYNAYTTWSEIMFGGETVQRARVRQQALSTDDYIQIGKWLDSQLKQYKVWVVLMPAGQFDTPFETGLRHNTSWRLVLLNDKEKLYVDVSTPQGMAIFKGIEDGSTQYPDECSRDIMIANNALSFGQKPEEIIRGLDSAMKAMESSSARIPGQLLQGYYERYPQLRPEIDAFWKRILDDFLAHEKEYLSRDGYYNRIVSAIVAIQDLIPIAQGQNDKQLVEFYGRKRDELISIVPDVRDKRW